MKMAEKPFSSALRATLRTRSIGRASCRMMAVRSAAKAVLSSRRGDPLTEYRASHSDGPRGNSHRCCEPQAHSIYALTLSIPAPDAVGVAVAALRLEEYGPAWAHRAEQRDPVQ